MTDTGNSSDVIAQTLHLFPDLGQLEEQIEQEPERILDSAFPEGDPGLRPSAMTARGALESGFEAAETNELDNAVQRHRKKVLQAGKNAIAKIRREGANAKLKPAEATGLEAIIFGVGRPAILVRSGHFLPPPEEWADLEAERDSIERAARSVGRIALAGHPLYVGTGFLVGDGVIMTNRHVAAVFSGPGQGKKWKFHPGVKARIDYVDNPDADPPIEFAIDRVLGIHETLDLALLKVDRASGQGAALPEPLTLAATTPNSLEGRKIYTLGYPARDPCNGAALMRSIFGDIFGVKRLQPGEIMAFFDDEGLFNHDCSTLGGNSGSCVVDLASHQVLGLHFQGYYLQYNQAVALWQLTADPLFKRARVRFA
jgi:hypothetical protein